LPAWATTSTADDGLAREPAEGTAELASGQRLWIFLYGTGSCSFYFMERGPTTVIANHWQMGLGLVSSEKGTYVLYAVMVNSHDNQLLIDALATAQKLKDDAPRLYRLPPDSRAAYITVVCCQ
jgi:hypothetical protein